MRILVDPLIAETVPDGTFGGPRSVSHDWTPAEQKAHYEALADAIGAPRRRPPLVRRPITPAA